MSRSHRLVAAPGVWLGLLGGGQLGRMFAMAAQSLGYRVAVFDPADDGPAASVADKHLSADYLDPSALESLAGLCAAITTEFENVPAESLAFLAAHCVTSPSAESVAIAQDRIAEKSFVASCGIAVVPHAVIESDDDIRRAPATLFPAILKASRLGYDGKGQEHVRDADAARAAFVRLGSRAAVLEKKLTLAFELSVIVARGADGATAIYPAAENIHRGGILVVSIVPAHSLTPALESDANAAALRIAHALDYTGVLCVEFFAVRGEIDAEIDAEADAADSRIRLVVNEIAPRPHNSGHYTIDACITSQFAQQARILAGLPLGVTRQHSPAVMLNLLGDLWFEDDASTAPREPDWSAVLEHPGANLHLYGKREARRGRKMGHVTVVAATANEADCVARSIAASLAIAPW